MRRVAAAHMLHHADKYDGKPWGMFLGPQVFWRAQDCIQTLLVLQELQHIPEAVVEMEKLASILWGQWSGFPNAGCQRFVLELPSILQSLKTLNALILSFSMWIQFQFLFWWLNSPEHSTDRKCAIVCNTSQKHRTANTNEFRHQLHSQRLAAWTHRNDNFAFTLLFTNLDYQS